MATHPPQPFPKTLVMALNWAATVWISYICSDIFDSNDWAFREETFIKSANESGEF